MKILGVCNANDSGAALIVDGKVTAAANEERFTRKKLTRDFPAQAIAYVLEQEGIGLADIDWVGCGAWGGIDIEHTLPELLNDVIAMTAQNPDASKVVKERILATVKSDTYAKSELLHEMRAFGIPEAKVLFCDHHLSHALVAFYPSPFDEAMVLTADGRGDFRSMTWWKASRTNGLTLLDQSTELKSLGAMYGFITKLLGFTPDRHEGKITGLAAYGKPSLVLDNLRKHIWFDTETGKIGGKIGDFYKPFLSADLPALKELMNSVPREDFAFAAQGLLEEVLVKYVTHHLAGSPEKSVNLCLSGGCMANVKLNFKLMQVQQVKNVYVAPSMGDGGNALGGAVFAAVRKDARHVIEMPDVYLGPGYINDEIERVMKVEGITYEKLYPQDKIQRVASMIHDGVIVGWFQGRMEFGPRALGHRSIISSAADPAINASLNTRLDRTEFMPFAPATISELASRCFVGWECSHASANYMTICYECTPWMVAQCPATVHIDNTARPQIVRREDNPEYHDVIKAYFALSGRPAIINTSFNHHEEPIVMSPIDAIRSYRKGNVDVLVMGDFLVKA